MQVNRICVNALDMAVVVFSDYIFSKAKRGKRSENRSIRVVGEDKLSETIRRRLLSFVRSAQSLLIKCKYAADMHATDPLLMDCLSDTLSRVH